MEQKRGRNMEAIKGRNWEMERMEESREERERRREETGRETGRETGSDTASHIEREKENKQRAM